MPSPLFPNFNRRQSEQNPQESLRKKIGSAVMRKLGSLGSLVESLIRPFGKSLTTDINKEIDAARDLIDALQNTAREKIAGGKPPIPPVRPEYRVGSAEPPDNDDWRLFPADQPIMEGMIDVQSSNVHSIGYLWPSTHAQSGDLLVRFLGNAGGGKRGGPGALYRYRSVPADIWRGFKAASSKGVFVWDELRVRGTISGHQFSYDLEEIGNLSHVPRQAGLKPGMAGEWWMQRDLRGRRSTLPERQVRGPRGTLPGWRGPAPAPRRTGPR